MRDKRLFRQDRNPCSNPKYRHDSSADECGIWDFVAVRATVPVIARAVRQAPRRESLEAFLDVGCWCLEFSFNSHVLKNLDPMVV